MKKIITALLLVVLLVGLVACGKQQDADSAAAADTQTYTGVVSEVRSDMLILEPKSEDGFSILFAVAEGLEDVKVGDQVTVTYTGELESIDAAPVAVSVEKVGS